MKRFLLLLLGCLFSLFLISGCSTVSGSIIDPEEPLPAIKTKYPYKFYLSSIEFCRTEPSGKFKIPYKNEQAFVSEIRRKLSALYPQIFVHQQDPFVIPLHYDIVFSIGDVGVFNILASFACVPFACVSLYSAGLFPFYMVLPRRINIRVNIANQIVASCMRNLSRHERMSFGILGFFGTQKLLPDFSDGDIPLMDGMSGQEEIVSTECSIKFLKLFVYALQSLNHEQVQLMYNEKYRPKEDFILP